LWYEAGGGERADNRFLTRWGQAMDIDLLTHVPLFAELSSADRDALSALLGHREVAANQVVCWIGESGTDFYIVQHGEVEVVQPDDDGKEQVLNRIGPGGFFGELALLDGGPRTATVRTLLDSRFVTLTRDAFLSFLPKHPAAVVHMLSELGKRQRAMLEMVRGVPNANAVLEVRQSFGQRFADLFARRMGSWTYLILQTVVFLTWVILNVGAIRGGEAWDPYPFSLFALMLTAVSGYAAPLIMMSQSRQSEKDHIRAELEYQVNVKAHHEVMQLHQKVDRLTDLLTQGAANDAG
jgi:uncharacterized membrane protein